MHELVLGIFVFIGAIVVSFAFSNDIMPGGNEDTKLIWGAILALNVTVAVCTSFIIKEIRKKQDK